MSSANKQTFAALAGKGVVVVARGVVPAHQAHLPGSRPRPRALLPPGLRAQRGWGARLLVPWGGMGGGSVRIGGVRGWKRGIFGAL